MGELNYIRPMRRDAYAEVYKTSALQMSDFSNSVRLHLYEHAVVDLCERYWTGQSSVNSHCSIFLTTGRNAYIHCNGEKVELIPYHFYFLPSQIKITLTCHDHARLYHTLFRMSSWSGLDLWYLLKPRVIELEQHPEALLKKYMESAKTSISEQPEPTDIGFEMQMFAMVYEILSLVFQKGEWLLPSHSPEAICRIENAVNFIERNPHKNHSVSDLAKRVSMSRERFSIEFKKIVGITPARYQMERRLQQIQMHLLNDDHTLGELAEMFGFSSAFHLSRMFKQHFGLAPKFFQQKRSLF